jgi:hypothetical protein
MSPVRPGAGPYVIERGIPLAKPLRRKRGNNTPLGRAISRLDVGESFAVPAEQVTKLSRAAYLVRESSEKKRVFKVRTVGEHARVWRVR